MARPELCSTCAGVTTSLLLAPDGLRIHELSSVIAHATGTAAPCDLCKLIWWALRGNHAHLETSLQPPVPVWLLRRPKNRCMLSVLAGATLEHVNRQVDAKYDLDEFVSGMNADLPGVTIGRLTIYSIRGDPMESLFSEKTIDLDPSSEKAFQLIKVQIQTCLDSHGPECSESRVQGKPCRLIDVNPSSSLDSLKLVNTSDLMQKQHDIDYVALSYCWGEEPRYVTTSANLKANQAAFRVSELPPTIQDAVTITRILDIRYLWVDALCVIQGADADAREDWKVESSRMAAIYSGATLTISAASAASAFDGILKPRLPPQPAMVTIPDQFLGILSRGTLAIGGDRLLATEAIEPLSRRAWALQEKILSRRDLIYGTSELVYACKTREWRESGAPHHYSQKLADWPSTVEDYTSRALSDSWDRLPAIQGLAKLFTETSGATYIEGLRPMFLAQDLLWRHVGRRGAARAQYRTEYPVPTVYRAPSWSWAAVDGAVRFHRLTDAPVPSLHLRCTWTAASKAAPAMPPRAVLQGSGAVWHVASIKLQASAAYDMHAHDSCPLVFLGSATRTFLDCPDAQGDMATTGGPKGAAHADLELHGLWFLELQPSAGLILRAAPHHARPRSRWASLRPGSKKQAQLPHDFERIGMYTTRSGDLRGEIFQLDDFRIY